MKSPQGKILSIAKYRKIPNTDENEAHERDLSLALFLFKKVLIKSWKELLNKKYLLNKFELSLRGFIF